MRCQCRKLPSEAGIYSLQQTLFTEYHSQSVVFEQVLAGSDGTAGNPAEGSRGPLSRDRLRRRMPSLRIGVPPGTVVKRGAAGRLLGELVNPGEPLAS